MNHRGFVERNHEYCLIETLTANMGIYYTLRWLHILNTHHGCNDMTYINLWFYLLHRYYQRPVKYNLKYYPYTF